MQLQPQLWTNVCRRRPLLFQAVSWISSNWSWELHKNHLYVLVAKALFTPHFCCCCFLLIILKELIKCVTPQGLQLWREAIKLRSWLWYQRTHSPYFLMTFLNEGACRSCKFKTFMSTFLLWATILKSLAVCECLESAMLVLIPLQGITTFPTGTFVTATEVIVGIATGFSPCGCQKAKLVFKCRKKRVGGAVAEALSNPWATMWAKDIPPCLCTSSEPAQFCVLGWFLLDWVERAFSQVWNWSVAFDFPSRHWVIKWIVSKALQVLLLHSVLRARK